MMKRFIQGFQSVTHKITTPSRHAAYTVTHPRVLPQLNVSMKFKNSEVQSPKGRGGYIQCSWLLGYLDTIEGSRALAASRYLLSVLSQRC